VRKNNADLRSACYLLIAPLSIAACMLVAAAPTPAPMPSVAPAPAESLPPIAVEMCQAEPESPDNPNLHVGISFRNLTDEEATTVRFDVFVLDGSGKLLNDQLVSIDGHFGPNVLISPKRSPLTGDILTQPEYPGSPAWNIANHFGSGARSVRCEVDSAEFADHTAWQRTPPE
jgi:hypothetical protein